ncbi:MAG: ATP-binding protein [Bacteroidetes bacterium]|nr:ATP-binding protein [Bacteroidota bacterium]
MIDQYIITLLSTFLSIYLPIIDQSTKIAVCLALSNILIILGKYIFDNFATFDRFHNLFNKEVSINLYEKTHPTSYNMIDNYISNKYPDKIKKRVSSENYSDMIIDEFLVNSIYDTFDYKGVDYQINIKLNKIHTDSKDKNNHLNHYYSFSHSYKNLDTDILNKYLKFITTSNTKVRFDNYLYFKLKIEIITKKKSYEWNSNYVMTNKRLSNTIISNDIKVNFVDDINTFIESKEKYKKIGIPYKRGYILYGEPGCGKTSLIKSIAIEHNLSIYSIDINDFDSNDEFISVIDKICNIKYMLIFEDIDRCRLFNENKGDDYKGITEDCLLNVLDGIDEGYGRITIMTTNNLDILKKCPALIRYGRIDKCVYLTYCTLDQMKNMLKLFFENETTLIDTLEEGTKITPSTLIHVIQYINDLPKIIEVLNKKIDLSSGEIEKLIE